MGILDRFWKRNGKVVEKSSTGNALQNAAAAAAFAEAGEHRTAREMVASTAPRAGKILAMGREDRFSEALQDYAVRMAGRLGCEMIAVNVSDAPLAIPIPWRDDVTDKFRGACAENARQFAAKAAEAGIAFRHEIEVGDPETVLEAIHKREKGVRFVLTEPDAEAIPSEGSTISIPVFDLAHYSPV